MSSTPLTPDQTLGALRKWGVRYRETPGWRTRNRAPRSWGPVVGFMNHHTGDDAPDALDRRVVTNGRSDLPGPLCHFGGNDDGVIDLIGCGRANHAGGGSPAVLAAVRDESYGDYPPATHHHDGSSGAADGNAAFYGLETYYSGSRVPTQYRSMVLLNAAILDAHDWSEKSSIGHKEWSDWKPDPGSIDMKDFRADVATCLRNGPQWSSAWCYGGANVKPAAPAAPGKPAPSEPVPATPITPAIPKTAEDDLMRLISTTPDGNARRVSLITARGTTSVSEAEQPAVRRYLDELNGGPGAQGVLRDSEVATVSAVLSRLK